MVQLSPNLGTMRTVLLVAALIGLAAASAIPTPAEITTVEVTPATVSKQYKVFHLFEALFQINVYADYYKTGKDYSIRANIDNYTNKEVVEKFLWMWENESFLPKYYTFTIFDEKVRKHTKALYDLFYYAKDWETFYKTAAWARVYVNEGMFAYTFYVATVQSKFTKDIVILPFYEIWPEYFANMEVFSKIYYSKMRGLPFEQYPEYGIVEEGNNYVFYANYSDYYTYGKEEFKISYFTEDIGWNSMYTFFHSLMPFWENGDNLSNGLLKSRRGELYFYFYQQLLARYYLERLVNSLGEIPVFSWYRPYEYGYRPFMTSKFYPFAQRSENYYLQTDNNLDDLRFIRNYEDIFMSFLEKGKFKAYNQEVDLYSSKAINFVGNFWQGNPDLYEKIEKTKYHHSYEMAARRVLGGAELSYELKEFEFLPTALDFYQTSLRDPAMYQIYNKIMGFMLKYKKYVQPYTQDQLHYVGVKISNVEISKLETFFEFYKFNASNCIYWSNPELTLAQKKNYVIAQPRLNRKSFEVKINVKSDVEEQATFKIFMGPKYDSKGNALTWEENWMNFVEMDWFTQKLTKGENVFVRNSENFRRFKEDSVSLGELYKYLEESKLPKDMLHSYYKLPERLMLPRGTKGGYPLQFFVVAYKTHSDQKSTTPVVTSYISENLDEKPLGYPLDRPASSYFFQPNMYVKEVNVYHDGAEYPWFYEFTHSNQVKAH